MRCLFSSFLLRHASSSEHDRFYSSSFVGLLGFTSTILLASSPGLPLECPPRGPGPVDPQGTPTEKLVESPAEYPGSSHPQKTVKSPAKYRWSARVPRESLKSPAEHPWRPPPPPQNSGAESRERSPKYPKNSLSENLRMAPTSVRCRAEILRCASGKRSSILKSYTPRYEVSSVEVYPSAFSESLTPCPN